MSIAICHGFLPGAQLPGHVATRGRLYFADQNWKQPRRAAYMAALAQHRPVLASVLDWEREEQLPEVLDWAAEAATHADQVMIVPKVCGGVARLPETVGGVPVVLGYSVGNKYGGTPVPVWEFAGRRVHLLGGAPHQQMRLWRYFRGIATVVSVDGNQLRQAANRGQVWMPGDTPRSANSRYWPTLNELGVPRLGRDMHLLAFHWSCINVQNAWRRIAAELGEERASP